MLSSAEISALLAGAEADLRTGRADDADARCRAVLARAADHPLAVHYLGVAACQLGRAEEGLKLLRRAAELAPDQPAFWYALGTTAGQWGLIDAAMDALQRAVQLNPDFAAAYNDLGQVYCLARRLGRAIECFRRALASEPNYQTAANNLVYYLHFDPAADGMMIRREAQAWAARFAEPLNRADRGLPLRDSSPARLRIGYVSPDLYEHPVGRFMHAVLSHRDRDAFEAIAYSDRAAPDAMSATLRSLCDAWRDTAGFADDALADLIRVDKIDILVDLSLHMGGNRLRVFARRPA